MGREAGNGGSADELSLVWGVKERTRAFKGGDIYNGRGSVSKCCGGASLRGREDGSGTGDNGAGGEWEAWRESRTPSHGSIFAGGAEAWGERRDLKVALQNWGDPSPPAVQRC